MDKMEPDSPAAKLLALPERAFVDECYRQILLREPDPEGVVHQLERVRSGNDRLLIAADISASDEARDVIRDRRSLAPAILAVHAQQLIVNAITKGRRQSAAKRIGRYLEVVGGISPQSGRQHEQAPDPFAEYLQSVVMK